MEGLKGSMLGDKDFCQAAAGFLEEASLKIKLNCAPVEGPDHLLQ